MDTFSASIGVKSSLLVEPSEELRVYLVGDHAEAFMKLSNVSSDHHVLYKIRTTNVDMFLVNPPQGVLPPGSSMQVAIDIATNDAIRLQSIPRSERTTERFSVQSVDIPDDMRGVQECLQNPSIDNFYRLWRHIPKEIVGSCKLSIAFEDDDPQSRYHRRQSSLHEPSRRASSNQSQCFQSTRTFSLSQLSRHSSGSRSDDTRRYNETSSNLVPRARPQCFLQPSDALTFRYVGNVAAVDATTFCIYNTSQYTCVAYKVKTTNQSGYLVKPNRGLIRAQGSQTVNCFLCDRDSDTDLTHMDVARAQQREANDRFLIEMLHLDPVQYQQLLSMEEHQGRKEIGRLFVDMQEGERERVVLRCRFIQVEGQSDGTNTRHSGPVQPNRSTKRSSRHVEHAARPSASDGGYSI